MLTTTVYRSWNGGSAKQMYVESLSSDLPESYLLFFLLK